MTAGMTDRDRTALLVGRRLGARVVQAGLLPDRESVHVGPQHDRGSGAVAQDGDHASAADPGGDVKVELREPLRHQGRGAMLLEAELRMRVQLSVQTERAGSRSGFSGIPEAM